MYPREGSRDLVRNHSRLEKCAFQNVGLLSLYQRLVTVSQYMGTSLIRNLPTLAPYSRFVSRTLWWSRGGGGFL